MYNDAVTPDSLNYRTVDKCDGCGETAEGTMLHAKGATGRICPVLFLCDKCMKGEASNDKA